MKTEIRNILEMFQNAYDQKDINQVDQFMEAVFSKEEAIAILGTSDGELSFGYDECRKLFISDWQYWGFEKLNLDECIIQEVKDKTICYVPSSFTFTFDVNEENRKGHLEDIINRIKLNSEDQRDLQVKFGEILYELVHIYHQRPLNPRKYRIQLNVTFIFNNNNRIIQINFSVPDNIRRPDARLYEKSDFNRYLSYELKKFMSKLKDTQSEDERAIRHLIKNFTADYFSKEINQYLDLNNIFAINVNSQVAKNIDEINSLRMNQQKYWDKLTIFDQEAYLEVYEDTAILLTKMIASKDIDNDEYFKETALEIEAINNDESLTITQKMFNIRQLITICFKETAIGSKHEFPLRVHFVLSKENNEWKINFFKMSYSFYYLLEERNEFMKYLK